MKQSTRETNVYTHTIGKILEENLSFIIMQRNSAVIGVLRSLLIITETVA